jgi:hypothetical protein
MVPDSSLGVCSPSVVDIGASLWSLCRLSSHPNILLCVMIDKKKVSRHVTEKNLAGLVRLMDDVVCLLGVSQVDSIVHHVGIALTDSFSWLRRQLRNPFALTWGASRVHLPEDLGRSLREICLHYNMNVGMWKGDLCVFSSFGEQINRMLGSFVMLGEDALFTLSREKAKDGMLGVDFKYNGQRVDPIRVHTYVLFVADIEKHDTDLADDIDCTSKNDDECRQKVAQEIVQLVSDFVKSFGWSRVDKRHIPGTRYCVEDDYRIQCSPRGKVSSSSHHVRSLATTLIDSLDSSCGQPSEFQRSVFACDRTGDTWACYSSNDDNTTRTVSVTLAGGLVRMPLVNEIARAKQSHLECCDKHSSDQEGRQGDCV